jgi:hypothetical protein
VETDVPVWAAAPGQAAVLYDGEVVLGGGRIARPEAVHPAARAVAPDTNRAAAAGAHATVRSAPPESVAGGAGGR